MESVADLWQRWHQSFRLSFLRLAYRPTKSWLCSRLRPWLKDDAVGTGSSSIHGVAVALLLPVLPLLEQALPLLAVFLLSGLVHEYMCWAAFGHAYQLAFFLLHGTAAVAETALHRAVPWLRASGAGRVLWQAASLAFAASTS